MGDASEHRRGLLGVPLTIVDRVLNESGHCRTRSRSTSTSNSSCPTRPRMRSWRRPWRPVLRRVRLDQRTSKPRSRTNHSPAVRRAGPGQVDLLLRTGGLQVARRCRRCRVRQSSQLGAEESSRRVAEATADGAETPAEFQAPLDAHRTLRCRRPSAHVLAILNRVHARVRTVRRLPTK